MKIWTAPSIRTCFKNALPFQNDSAHFLLCAAKGEFVSMQVLLRNPVWPENYKDPKKYKTKKITGVQITQTVGTEFDISQIRVQAQEYRAFSDGITYPDSLSNGIEVEVTPNTSQSMWITFPIDSSQMAGEYAFHVKFDCDDEDENAVDITLKVFEVEIPPSNTGAYLMEHFHTPHDPLVMEDGGYNCTVFHDKWWEFMEEFARSLRECRSNVYRIYPVELLKACGSKRISTEQWHFDFSIFDRMVDLLIKTGTVKKFAIDDLLTSWEGREIKMIDEQGEILLVDISDPDAEMWTKAFFTALYEHITSHSSATDWIIHLQDEPTDPATWLWLRGQVRQYMPELRCGNPLCNKGLAQKLGDEVDIYIPLFNLVEDELPFFEDVLTNSNKEIWGYCCCLPQDEWYLNRFIDKPVIHSRLIGWATYSRRLHGYLHYGYNFWQKTDPFYCFSVNWDSQFKGDCMMVYPSPEDNSYRISVRYINIRDGAQDFELLKIVEKADKEKALKLSRKIAVGYKDFDMDEQRFMEARRELLKMAENCQN